MLGSGFLTWNFLVIHKYQMIPGWLIINFQFYNILMYILLDFEPCSCCHWLSLSVGDPGLSTVYKYLGNRSMRPGLHWTTERQWQPAPRIQPPPQPATNTSNFHRTCGNILTWSKIPLWNKALMLKICIYVFFLFIFPFWCGRHFPAMQNAAP